MIGPNRASERGICEVKVERFEGKWKKKEKKRREEEECEETVEVEEGLSELRGK